MSSTLITESNRGLGREWARQYAMEGWRVFATCRHPAEASALTKLAEQHSTLTIHWLDVTVPEDLRALFRELEEEPIDILLNNAGIYIEKNSAQFGSLCYRDWARTFEVNTMGAMRVSEYFTENIARSKKRLIIAVSSHMGSIADIESPGEYYCRSSKAALNAAMQGLAAVLKPRGIAVLILHPGGMRTRMGPRGGISPEESVRGMRRIVEKFTLERTGRFIKFDCTPMPW
jgi:NAD(P)-dependent dehydrogenase (short-subunit alcohol dehydrogenase family)